MERVGIVYNLLKSVGRNNFPIVDTATSGTLYGTASRAMLCTLLQRRAFGQPHDVNNGHYHSNADGSADYAELLGPKRLSPLVQWDTIERVYPRYPTIDDVLLRPGDRNCWLDLRPYANTAPYTINETASIQQTYRLFRTLGLRFLCAVNHNNQVVGIDHLPSGFASRVIIGFNHEGQERAHDTWRLPLNK